MKKRVLSLFLAVVFCFCLLPAGALEENDDTKTGGTTVLSADDAPAGEPTRTVPTGKRTVQGAATIQQTGQSPDIVKVAKCTAHVNDNDDSFCDYCNTDLSSAAVASVLTGGKTCYYTTLADAVAEAKDGDVITLEKNVTLADNENITIQKNGRL